MEVDVKIREVSSWGIKVLLRNEASESNTSRFTKFRFLFVSLPQFIVEKEDN